MSEVIAERIFRTRKDSPVAARVYAPERTGTSSEWSCKIEITGLEAPYETSAIGADSFQALYSGLYVLCAQLDRSAARLRHLDGDEGDVDTPLIVTWSYGLSLKKDIRRLVDEKIKEALEGNSENTR